MANVTRKQHYVWRYYLKAWTVKDKIWCAREGRVFSSGLMGVANIRDFYKLHELTENDIDLIQKQFLDPLSPELKKLNQKWIDLFTFVHRRKRLIQERGGNPHQEAEEELRNYCIEFEEKIHSEIERSSIPYIDAIRESNLSFLQCESAKSKFIYFMCVQYFRTNNIGQAMKAKLKVKELNEAIWNVLAHILATTLGWHICLDSNLNFVLLINKTSTPFITGDQPVINTQADYKNLASQSSQLELYYPQGPKLGLLISKDATYAGKEQVEVDEKTVVDLNQLIQRASFEQLYADSEWILKNLLTSLNGLGHKIALIDDLSSTEDVAEIAKLAKTAGSPI